MLQFVPYATLEIFIERNALRRQTKSEYVFAGPFGDIPASLKSMDHLYISNVGLWAEEHPLKNYEIAMFGYVCCEFELL